MPSATDNLFDCNKPDLWIPYFLDAESHMESQWNTHIWPRIANFDFSCGLELSPGGGRNTKRLMAHTQELHLVDYNKYPITLCRFRFMDYSGPCKLHFHVNDGRSLSMIPDSAITFGYSWDSAVHFDREIVCDYIREFARVLSPGGKVFIHHSNLGEKASPKIRENPGWRSNMDAALAAKTAKDCGMEVVEQYLFDWGQPDMDCVSVFRKL